MNEMNTNSKERIWQWGQVALVVLSVFLIVQIINGIKEYRYIGENIQNQPTISFNGKGEVSAVPDIATFSFSVTKSAATVSDAQTAMAKIANAAVDYVKSKGVAEKDIQTSDYNVYPKYEYRQTVCTNSYCPPSNQVLTGYEVSETLTVKVRTVTDAGAILGGLGQTGVTNISGLSFTVDNHDELAREARQEAIDDAKKQAQSLAKDLGVRLGRIVSFSEGGMGQPIYYGAKATLGMGGDSASAPVPEIQTGENKIISNVTITYEIK